MLFHHPSTLQIKCIFQVFICVLSGEYDPLSSVLPKVKESGKSHSVHVMRGSLRVSPGGDHSHDTLICVYCKLITKLTVGTPGKKGILFLRCLSP